MIIQNNFTEIYMENIIPLVSIITPSFNQGAFIEDSILSVKNQYYSNIEHIIVDGGSTDNTLDVLKKYERTYNLRWISERDRGQSDAINKGFRMAKGEIVGWLNSDDAYFSKYTISKIVRFYEEKKSCDIVYGHAVLIDSKNTVIRISPIMPSFNYAALKIRNFLAQPSVFFKKSIVDEYMLNPHLHYGMDYDLWLRVGGKNKFYYINQILSCFRLHESSKTVAQFDMMENEIADISKEYMRHLEKPTLLDRLTHAARLLLPVLSLPDALRLYERHDFAFDLKLPSRKNIIINTMLIPELRCRLNGLIKH